MGTICVTGKGHRWAAAGHPRDFCIDCGASPLEGVGIDWNKPLEPGPVKIDAPGDERERARHDVKMTGIGFLVDGRRVDPSRVTIMRPTGTDNDMTTTELWKALEDVLREKGATDAWIEYALPELQIAASQFAFDQFGRGHRSACRGEALPNPGPDDKLMVFRTDADGSRWWSIDSPTLQMIKAPLPSGMLDTPEARQKLQQAVCSHDWEYKGTDGHGSHKGEDMYHCRKCGAYEYRID